MKPNFALSLSFEGIGLLHRAFPGWNRVGEVALDSPDLSGALEVLRETAQQINGQDLASKLVIPNEQIKFLCLDLGVVDEAERTKAILKALEGATPYPVAQLVYDWSVDGDKTQVAAVARETLAEAEKFATEHGFGPVCFVAIPPTDQFSGEPFFGPTNYATALLGDGAEVQRDLAPIRVTGVVRLPDPGDEDDAAESAEAADKNEDIATEDLTPETVLVQPKDYLDQLESDAEQATSADSETEPNLAVDPVAVSVLCDTLPSIEDEDVSGHSNVELSSASEMPEAGEEDGVLGSPDETDPSENETGVGEDSAPAFSTIRAHQDDDLTADAPLLSGVRRNLEDLLAPVPAPVIASDGEDASPQIEATPASYGGFGVNEGPRAPDQASSENSQPSGGQPIGANPTSEAQAGRLSFFSRRGTELASGIAGSLRNSLANRSGRRVEAPIADVAQPVESSLEATDLETERQRMTVFGARKADAEQQVVGGKPRYLGLVLTAILLILLAGVAAWASLFLDDGMARLFGPRDTEVSILAPDTVDEMVAEGEEAMVSETLGESLETASLEPLSEPAQSVPLAQPNLPHALTESEAQARYAVSGVWQRAPQEPQLPDQLSIDDLYLTSIDPRVDAQDAVALPEINALATDQAMGPVALPAKRGTRFELDERGLVVARVEGALSPEGFFVFAGRPPSVPRSLPQRSGADEPAVSAEQERLSTIRPRPRPEGLISQNERANLGGLTRTELASKRPKTRPASALQLAQEKREQEEVETAAQAAVENALAEAAAATIPFDSATALAVAQSRKPKPRPRNFAKVVDQARIAQESDENREVTKVAAAVPQQQKTAPNIPSKASVAKAATVRNQINLRKINLIGVYGKPNSRRALVRLSNGRYKKVQGGDRLDGGRISAIGDGELRYQKNGRNVILKMPRG